MGLCRTARRNTNRKLMLALKLQESNFVPKIIYLFEWFMYNADTILYYPHICAWIFHIPCSNSFLANALYLSYLSHAFYSLRPSHPIRSCLGALRTIAMTSVEGDNGVYRSLEERMTSETNFGEFHDLFYKKGSRPLGEGRYDVTCFVRCISPIFILVATKNARIRYCMSTWRILIPRDSLGLASQISWPNYLQAIMSLATFLSFFFQRVSPRISEVR
jgi:hypothetical protein